MKDEVQSKALPQHRRDRLVERYDMSHTNAFIFVANDLDALIDAVVELPSFTDEMRRSGATKLLVNTIRVDYLHQKNKNAAELNKLDTLTRARKIASFVRLMHERRISDRSTKHLFDMLFAPDNGGKMADELVAEHDLWIVDDERQLTELMRRLMATSPEACQKYAKKKLKIIDHFTTRMHAELRDRAERHLVDSVVKRELEKLTHDAQPTPK